MKRTKMRRCEGEKVCKRWKLGSNGSRNSEWGMRKRKKVGIPEVRGQRPDGWMIRMKNMTSVSKHFTDQAGNLGLRVSLRLLEEMEGGIGTRRRLIGRDYAVAKDAEGGKG